jgi:hypothetical protein
MEVRMRMEMLEENATKVMIALLGTEVRAYSGQELNMETGLTPDKLNAAVDLLHGREMISVVNASPRTPYSFGTVQVTEHGQKIFRDLKSEAPC